MSIAALLAAALTALTLIISAMAAVTLWSVDEAARAMDQAARRSNHLENARTIEAAFYRYLMVETIRRLQADPTPRESREAAELRGALHAYRLSVRSEVVGGDLEARRGALVRASALAGLFEAVERASMRDRALGPRDRPLAWAQEFVTVIASARDQTFRSSVEGAVAVERAGLAQGRARLEAVSARARRDSIILTAVFAAAALAVWIIGRRLLARPVQALARTAEAFAQGDYSARALPRAPGEFALLSARFNAMAARIAEAHSRLETEVAARTADLAAANAALTRIDQTRRQFFAVVSHELRTPVTALLGEAQIALRRAPTPPEDPAGAALHGAGTRIAASGGYLRRRLDDLMALARSDDGALTATPEHTDAAAEVRAAVETATAFAASREAVLTCQAPESAPIWADPAAVRQATLALIDNAVKFSPPGGQVTVSVARLADGAVDISVEDDGAGFGEQNPDRLFDRYAQGDGGPRAGGAGLGLSVVKWIAEAHGGTAQAADRPEGGSIVRFTLPAPTQETPL